MSLAGFVNRLPVLIRPDPARVVVRPYLPSRDAPPAGAPSLPRARRIAERVLALAPDEVAEELDRILADFSGRHRDVAGMFERRFGELDDLGLPGVDLAPEQRRLIGAHFCHEYSCEAAALFNPSIVAHPDQTGVPPGALRFVLSLRGVGEGHVSSVTFRTGLVAGDGAVLIDPPSPRPATMSAEPIPGSGERGWGTRIVCDGTHDLSEIVIFPVTPGQRHGIEDLRLVRFAGDDAPARYLGTYTAFSGEGIRQELLATDDFRRFDLQPLRGGATRSKGMALFPRRVGGRFAMLGRQDNESIWLLRSSDLFEWNRGAIAVAPRWPWEFVQIGNCGSPIETEAGWLVLTHGVGAMRNYAIGACLLDRDDPGRLLARTRYPLVRSDAEEREGYVPNVAYSCGALLHGGTLVLPYGVADSFTTFATMALEDLLAAME